MLLLVACIFLFRQYGTTAAPVSTLSPDSNSLIKDVLILTRNDVSSACLGRSTWDIFWSCLATTFAVTWVSVHPNIPWHEAGEWSIRQRKLFLMLVALLTPEVMIVWAYKQWRGAVMITETINHVRPQSCPQMTRAKAHWLQMGGFKLTYVKGEIAERNRDPQADEKTFRERFETAFASRSKCLPDEDVWEIVLTYSILIDLLIEDRIDFPNITEEEIKDRSKGDALSKGMVLLQITWFLGQLTARAHQQLTITHIELTTAALAILNSVVYLFWWSKPLDVRCPITVQTKKVMRLQLHADGMSLKDCSCDENKKIEESNGNTIQASVSQWKFYQSDEVSGTSYSIIDRFHIGIHLSTVARDFVSQVQSLILHVLLDTAILLHWPRIKNDIIAILGIFHSTVRCTEKSSSDRHDSSFIVFRVIRWIFSHFKSMIWLLSRITVTPMRSIIRINTCNIQYVTDFADIRDRIHSKTKLMLLFDWPVLQWTFVTLFYSEESAPKPLLRFAASAGAMFASMHCFAWHFDFPSSFERILWRISSLSLVGLFFCIIVGTFLIRIPSSRMFRVRVVAPTVRLSGFFTELLFPFTYPFFRISLLTIALLSIRDLPDTAFETVSWTGYIPHI